MVLTDLGGAERYTLATGWRDRAVMSGELQVDFSSELGYNRELQWHTIMSCSDHTDYLGRQFCDNQQSFIGNWEIVVCLFCK